MSGEIIDEYFRLIEPDGHKVFQEAAWPILKPLAAMSPEQVDEIQRDRWRKHLAQFDHAVLEAVGWTVDDLIDERYQRLKERAGGFGVPQSDWRIKQRERALLAIRKADTAKLGWSETIASAQQASLSSTRREIDRKTVDKWLRELHRAGLISIEPPPERGRGRPRKKD